MELLVIGRSQVGELLPMDECIEVMDRAMRSAARGDTVQPLRSVMGLPGERGVLGLMPGYLGDPECFGVKAISVFPGNFGTRFQSHQGAVLIFEPGNGCLLAVVAAGEITAVRTAAASGLATRVLAREEAGELAILGYGHQARTHLEAMKMVRDIRRVRVWGRSPDKARQFAAREGDRHGLDIEVAASVEEAVSKADIVCTVTAASEPILRGAWLAPGTHLNVVGSSVPGTAEIDTEAVTRSRFFVDSRQSVLSQGGEFLNARKAGAIDDNHILAEIGEVLAGGREGRRSADEITLYKSLGIVVEDLASAFHVYEKARRKGIGTVADF